MTRPSFAPPASAGFIFAQRRDIEAYQAHVMGVEPIETEQSVPPEFIASIGRLAAESGIPVNCCPFRDPAVADRWRRAWHQRDMELQAEIY